MESLRLWYNNDDMWPCIYQLRLLPQPKLKVNVYQVIILDAVVQEKIDQTNSYKGSLMYSNILPLCLQSFAW